MQISRTYSLNEFDNLEHGALVIAAVSRTAIVRGMKGFYVESSETQSDRFVTLGPFLRSGDDIPRIYDPAVVAGRPVLDVTGVCQFVPSLSPADLASEFALPSMDDSIGLAFFFDDSTWLGVFSDPPGGITSATHYLNVATGELRLSLGEERCLCTSRWSINQMAGDRKFDHKILDSSGSKVTFYD